MVWLVDDIAPRGGKWIVEEKGGVLLVLKQLRRYCTPAVIVPRIILITVRWPEWCETNYFSSEDDESYSCVSVVPLLQ